MEKILYMIEALVKDIAGANGLRLLKELMYKENVSEVKLAENLKLGVNEVRSLLYKLHAYNLVYSTRKKDKEKGWYIYYWTFNFNHGRDILIRKKKKRLERLKEEGYRRKNVDVYECKNKCMELNLNEAMGYNFRCPDCEQLLIHKDNTVHLEKLEKEIKETENDIEILKQPIKITVKKEVKGVRRKKIEKKIKKKIRKKKARPQKRKKRGEVKSKRKNIKKKIVKKKKAKPKKKPVKKKEVRKKGFFGKLKIKVGF
ncbi:MAG: hypothetical protein ISS82_03560 [Nanoarchaeota archaeon]|nr:hypothetical protein [Nanoarchaeota archaeon]